MTIVDGARIVALADLAPELVGGVERIYLEAFPETERIPFGELLDPPPGENRAVVALVERPGVRGFASLYWLRGYPALLVEFLAVAAESRNEGRGSTLWQHIQQLAGQTSANGVVLEVEDPDQSGIDAAEAHLRRRRIGFYQRGGAQVLPVVDYRAPSRVGGPDVPFKILWSPAAGGQDGFALAPDALVAAVLWESYGVPSARPQGRA